VLIKRVEATASSALTDIVLTAFIAADDRYLSAALRLNYRHCKDF
jgi:hypothetical protein